MIELIRNEINTNFLKSNTDIFSTGSYTIHCSRAFKDSLIESILRAAFIIDAPSSSNVGKVEITQIFTPSIGTLTLIVDREQGYEIEKIPSTQNQPKIVDGAINNILRKVYPRLDNTYCFDNNHFMMNDEITDGENVYTVLNNGIQWTDGFGSFWVFTLDREVVSPLGRKFYKTKTK